jgi:hypothetical protein
MVGRVGLACTLELVHSCPRAGARASCVALPSDLSSSCSVYYPEQIAVQNAPASRTRVIHFTPALRVLLRERARSFLRTYSHHEYSAAAAQVILGCLNT